MVLKQRGAVLIVSLLLLIVMTVLGVSAINMTSTDLRIAENTQQQMEAETAVQEAIEQVMSYFENFDINEYGYGYDSNPTVTVNGVKTQLDSSTLAINGRNVVVQSRVCLGARHVEGDSIREKTSTGDSPGKYIKIWEIEASHSDPVSGAQVTLHQGVKLRMLSDKCP